MPARIGPVILIALVLGTAAACDGGSPEPAAAPPPTPSHQHTTPAAPTAAPTAAAAQRVAFEQAFGHHALLAVRLMRSGRPGTAQRQAAEAAAQANAAELTRLMGAAFGAANGDRFESLWREHLAHLTAYADAAGGEDETARRRARDALLAGTAPYGSLMAEATGGKVTAAEAERAMRHHAEQLIGQADASADGEHGRAYQLEREAYEHMFATGTEMAKAALPARAAARLATPPEQLRSAFAMLLGEHMELIVDAQRAAFAGAPQFEAAAAQVNVNTAALGKAMGAIVGPAKGAEFQHDWSEHVEGLIAYAAAVAAGDEAAKGEAREEMGEYTLDLAKYLHGIVGDRLELGLLLGALTQHDRHLVDHVDAFARRDYAGADRTESATYQHMRVVADTLADAIQRRVRAGLPVGGSQTGGGGTATRRR
jgi:hypothetical protein